MVPQYEHILDETFACWCAPTYRDELESVCFDTPMGLISVAQVSRTIVHSEEPMLRRRYGRPRIANPRIGQGHPLPGPTLADLAEAIEKLGPSL